MRLDSIWITEGDLKGRNATVIFDYLLTAYRQRELYVLQGDKSTEIADKLRSLDFYIKQFESVIFSEIPTIQEDDYTDYSNNYNYTDEDDDKKEIPIAVQDSFFEKLQQQLDLLALDDRDFLIGQQIIGSLDDDGYLRRPILSLIDDLAFSQKIFSECNPSALTNCQ